MGGGWFREGGCGDDGRALHAEDARLTAKKGGGEPVASERQSDIACTQRSMIQQLPLGRGPCKNSDDRAALPLPREPRGGHETPCTEPRGTEASGQGDGTSAPQGPRRARRPRKPSWTGTGAARLEGNATLGEWPGGGAGLQVALDDLVLWKCRDWRVVRKVLFPEGPWPEPE